MMSEKTNLTIKIDKDERDSFSSLCDELGISMASVLNAFIKQTIRQREIKFSVTDANGFTPEESKELKRRISEVHQGKAEAHNLIEA